MFCAAKLLHCGSRARGCTCTGRDICPCLCECPRCAWEAKIFKHCLGTFTNVRRYNVMCVRLYGTFCAYARLGIVRCAARYATISNHLGSSVPSSMNCIFSHMLGIPNDLHTPCHCRSCNTGCNHRRRSLRSLHTNFRSHFPKGTSWGRPSRH